MTEFWNEGDRTRSGSSIRQYRKRLFFIVIVIVIIIVIVIVIGVVMIKR